MIAHILHILSRNRITSLLLFLLLSAAVLVTLLSIGSILEKMQYFFLPRGYDIRNVAILYVESQDEKNTDNAKDEELYNRLKASPFVENISYSTPNLIYNYTRYDMVGYNNKVFSAYLRGGTESMADIMHIETLYGRWLQLSDHSTNGVVITPEAAKALFNKENAVGESIEFKEQKFHVVGVCNSIRQHNRENFSPSFFTYQKTRGAFTIRIKEGEEKSFAHSIENILTAVYGTDNYTLYFETMQHQDFRVNQFIYVELFQFLLLRLFILIVALLSFVAVIWYSVERRVQEWSIRYVIGRTKTQLTGYIFLENLVILVASFAFALVMFFTIRHFGVETFASKFTLPAIAIAILLMLFFLWIGIFIPSRKIKQLNMSELLKSE